MSAEDTGKQDCQAQQACDFCPMRCDERQERRGDQKAADDGDHHRDVDARSERRKCDTDGGDNRRRDYAVSFPSRKISFEALPIGSVKHHAGLSARPSRDDVNANQATRYASALCLQLQDQVQMRH
jgi:hypothetical protein